MRLPHTVVRRRTDEFGYTVKRVFTDYGSQVLGTVWRLKGQRDTRWAARREGANLQDLGYDQFATRREAVSWLERVGPMEPTIDRQPT